jgi:hypothetical protein
LCWQPSLRAGRGWSRTLTSRRNPGRSPSAVPETPPHPNHRRFPLQIHRQGTGVEWTYCAHDTPHSALVPSRGPLRRDVPARDRIGRASERRPGTPGGWSAPLAVPGSDNGLLPAGHRHHPCKGPRDNGVSSCPARTPLSVADRARKFPIDRVAGMIGASARPGNPLLLQARGVWNSC